jgi:flagellar basal-body rod protein FlgG
VAESTAIDYSSGPVSTTGNTFDLALDGEGFFVVNTPNGKAYTRQGNFRVDSSGTLVTVDGYEVMGQGGPVSIKGGTVSFSAEGKIFVEGVETGAIQVVDFAKPYELRKIGQGLLVPNDPAVTSQPAPKTSVMQGRLEGSNVSAVAEMVQLIETSRFFEACQKVIQNYDAMTGKAVNELGKV